MKKIILYQVLIAVFLFNYISEASLMNCASLEDLRKLPEQTWLVRVFGILMTPMVYLVLRYCEETEEPSPEAKDRANNKDSWSNTLAPLRVKIDKVSEWTYLTR